MFTSRSSLAEKKMQKAHKNLELWGKISTSTREKNAQLE